MWFFNLLYGIHSAFKCRGKHDWRITTVFLPDPNGPDLFRGFPSDPPVPVDALPFGGNQRGRYHTYSRCWNCGLRSDGGYDP